MMTAHQNSTVPKPIRRAADQLGWGALLWVQWVDTRFLSWKRWFVFEGGLLYAHGWRSSVQAMHPWTDVQALRFYLDMYIQHDQDLGSVRTQTKHVHDLTFSDGSTCQIALVERPLRTLAQDFFAYGMRADIPPDPVVAIAEQIRQKVVEAQFPQICSQLESGQEVRFGPLSATIDGLRVDEQLFPWNKVSAPAFTHKYVRSQFGNQMSMVMLRVTDQDGQSKWRDYRARAIDNFPTLELLYTTMNSSAALRRAPEAQ